LLRSAACMVAVMILTFSAFHLPVCSALSVLRPSQVAIIVNGNNDQSIALGHYYAKARHIPLANIIELNLPDNVQDITAPFYDVRVAAAIRQILTERNMRSQIRCLVTTYGIPLKVGPQSPSFADMAEVKHLRARLIEINTDLRASIRRLDSMDGLTEPKIVPPGNLTVLAGGRLRTRVYTTALECKAALAQTLTFFNRHPVAKTAADNTEIFALFRHCLGVAVMAQSLHVHGSSLQSMELADFLRQEKIKTLLAVRQYDMLKVHRYKAANRREMRHIKRRFFGLVGEAVEDISQITYLLHVHSKSSLDSDLMMLWYGRIYHSGWYQNPIQLENWHANLAALHPRIMMVSRIDGLNIQMVEAMIARGLRVEARGLRGKVYIDARGLHGTDPYSQFDRLLRRTAAMLKVEAKIPVVLNDVPALFKRADSPDCAVYCGWYSVHHFVNCCQWVPGFVGYHVASFELDSLHNPTDTAWCINLLKHKACGTSGPVWEPYLFSFPPPNLFIPLLLSGEFPQVEVYSVSIPNLAWRQAYVGDPLYNPFRHDPRFSRADIRGDRTLNKIYEIRDAWVPLREFSIKYIMHMK
jgi:uncharacterized protein (TIGR03790 family)